MSDAYTQIDRLKNFLTSTECLILAGKLESHGNWLREQEEKKKRSNAAPTCCQTPNITVTHGGLWNERK